MDGELIAHVRRAFGWTGDVEVSAGPRGARGQVWRLTVGRKVAAPHRRRPRHRARRPHVGGP